MELNVGDLREAVDQMGLTMANGPRDWSTTPRDAWLFGLVVGWGKATGEVARLHSWDSARMADYMRYRGAVRGLLELDASSARRIVIAAPDALRDVVIPLRTSRRV